jgi:4-hydroxy-tetrahydrodipicolinate reductase
MKFILIGYGKMGKTIEEIILDRGHEIAAIIDEHSTDQLGHSSLTADVAIDFSTPDSVVDHIKTCVSRQLPIVVGTTGWNQHEKVLNELAISSNSTLMYSSNFSLGVNLFFKVNNMLAQMMDMFPSYQTRIEETHHVHKVDQPSGTAISLADQILKSNKNYHQWVNEPSDQKDKLNIKSIRKDEVPGTHQVTYTSDIDEISIIHTAKNRKGFALGAVLAGEWVADKKGVFTMDDFLNF